MWLFQLFPRLLWTRRFGMVGLLGLMALSADALERRANTSLTLPQQPPRLGYKWVDTFPGVTFANPVTIASPPGETNRLFIVEKGGQIAVVTNLANPRRSVFLDLTRRGLMTGGESGVLGLAFHPGFASNGFFFVFYSLSNHLSEDGRGLHQRLSRFQAIPPTANQVELSTERPLITQYDQAPNHNGGDLHFGPDGYLYVSVGDEGGGNDTYNNAQRLDKDFFAGILRIDVDARPENLEPTTHAALRDGNALPYRIPADNPWVSATDLGGKALDRQKLRAEFYAIGLRNPWKFSFDTESGILFCGDVGQEVREEINIIVKGGNYGWPYQEGTLAGPKAGSKPASITLLPPLHEYLHGSTGTLTGNSVTGGRAYRGSRLPELNGSYLFGDYISGNLWAIHPDASYSGGKIRLTSERFSAGFGADPRNQDLLVASYAENKIKRLDFDPAVVGSPLPSLLSGTGAFSDLATLEPQPGIEAYTINAPFWSDGAEKRRWFSVPKTNAFIGFSVTNLWIFPTGMVWIKHFDLTTNEMTGAKRRLETRFLVKNASGAYGITYRWAPGSRDATLVSDQGLEEAIEILTADGSVRTQQWSYPSRSSCLACHTSGAGTALGFSTWQLNHDETQPDSSSVNQLRILANAGYFDRPVPPTDTLPRLVATTDSTASLEYRVRSYLDANCSACHHPGGTAPNTWDARFGTPTGLTRILGGPLNDPGNSSSNRIVVQGDIVHSMLLSRISTRGAKQMPPLGSNELDRKSIELVRDWILSQELLSRGSYEAWRFGFLDGLPLPETEPSADADRDGATNEQEKLAGTHPRNAADKLAVEIRSQAGSLELVTTQPANRRLRIEMKNSALMDDPWTELPFKAATPLHQRDPLQVVIPLGSSPGEGRYYRVRVDGL
jgi:glucose/arabinose dehydrogenase/mono/diheme cytochrome c family protein